jgi:hypothetical protein
VPKKNKSHSLTEDNYEKEGRDPEALSEWPYVKKGRLAPIDYETVIKARKPWEDPNFPPDESSMFLNSLRHQKAGKLQKKKIWNEYKWIRASHFFNGAKYCLFDSIEPEDVKQGNIDNCHLMATMSGIAERDMEAEYEEKKPGKSVRNIFIT